MSFETTFENWISNSLNEKIPSEVKGFSFNLFETTEGFGIELIGASKFSKDDEDWACYEVFEPLQRQLMIPIEFSGTTWQSCLENMKILIKKYIGNNTKISQILKSVEGVGIGFVDGNLEVIWKS